MVISRANYYMTQLLFLDEFQSELIFKIHSASRSLMKEISILVRSFPVLRMKLLQLQRIFVRGVTKYAMK